MGYRICSILSYQIVAVTVGWHVYALTRDPWMLGLIGLAEVLPYFCVAPFAGYLVDQLPRRRLGMLACVALATTPLLLAAIARGHLGGGVAAIYAAVALTGAVRAFLGPVYNALFARVLPRAQFARGASLGSIVFQSGLVVGPALGGAIVGWAGEAPAYVTAGVVALLAAVALARLKV
ncbi:MAG TPA: MFS transporter, partial [Luteimonas sp.]|nr:MFS transporter [Luteimonas sp.]